jgi:hypothetical protein
VSVFCSTPGNPIQFGTLPAEFTAVLGRVEQLERTTASQAETLGEQTKIMEAQVEQLDGQNAMIEEQKQVIETQRRELAGLRQEQNTINSAIGDTRRRQTDNDNLVAAITTALQSKSSIRHAATPPPKFNVHDNLSAQLLPTWLGAQRLFLDVSGVDMADDKQLIRLTLLNMHPQTMAEAQSVVRGAKPKDAPDTWQPTFEEFVAALIRRWGGNPAQVAHDKVHNLVMTGTLPKYIATFTRLVEQACSDEMFLIEPHQQVLLFLKGLPETLRLSTGANLQTLTGKTMEQVVDAAVEMQRLFQIVQKTNTASKPQASEGQAPPKRKLKVRPGGEASGGSQPSFSPPAQKKQRPTQHFTPKFGGSRPADHGQGSKARTGPMDESEPVTCYKCNKKGHKANVCRSGSQKPDSGYKGKGKGKSSHQTKEDF